MELALQAAGHKFPRLSQVGAAWATDEGPPTHVEVSPPIEHPARFDSSTNGYGILIPDITWTVDGQLRLIEANGSNAALTSAILGKDDARAHHMYMAYKAKPKPRGQVVALLAYQNTLLHMAEFFGRAGLFAEHVAGNQATRLCDTVENLGHDEEISIVCGTITDIAEHVTHHNGMLFFKDRPVAFATNPNLLAELVRKNIIGRTGEWYDLDTSFYHEAICTPVVHNKGIQQDLAKGTGITPLLHRSAYSVEDCMRVLEEFWTKELVAVGKMNAGSGGAGIEFFPPGNVQVAEVRLKILVETAVTKHGIEVMKSIFPIRFFEFAESTPYALYGNDHLWDLRIQCLIYPGYVEVTPCVIRLCPEPFDRTTYDWDGVVSNLTGRNPETLGRQLRSPAAKRRSVPNQTVLESIGITNQMLNEIEASCAKWAEAAWNLYA